MQDSIAYFYFGIIVAGIAQAVYVAVFLRLFGCCCCFCSTVAKWSFRLSSFVLLAAIALSCGSAILMSMAFQSFTEALDQWIKSDNAFWDTVADIFLGFTIAVLLPAIYAAPVELAVCRASFAEREDGGVTTVAVEINNDKTDDIGSGL